MDELPPGLANWLAIEECVSATLSRLRSFGAEAGDASAFVDDIYRRVKVWLTFEFWAGLVEGGYTPDTLFSGLSKDPGSIAVVGQFETPTLPRIENEPEWPAFEHDADA
jgi:hypothetical protein